jgi:hypothetical protein
VANDHRCPAKRFTNRQITSDTKVRHAPISQTASQPFTCRQGLVQSTDTRVPQTKQRPRLATRSLAFPVTPAMRGWNEFSAFIEEWDGFRRAA